jgi:ribonuclease VapC
VIIDTSALIAVLLEENDAPIFAGVLLRAESVKISAATYVELVTVLDRRVGFKAVEAGDRLIARAEIKIVPFTPVQADLARYARLTYGRGRHGADLNFGDCFAYALARDAGEPLLFKGGDFAKTDIVPAI